MTVTDQRSVTGTHLRYREFILLPSEARSLTLFNHRGPCRERLPPVALPGATLLQKGAKQVFIVTVTGQRSVTGTHLGYREFILLPSEARFLTLFNHRGPCRERLPPVALPGANLLQKGAKQVLIVPMTGLWPVMGTHVGSRGPVPGRRRPFSGHFHPIRPMFYPRTWDSKTKQVKRPVKTISASRRTLTSTTFFFPFLSSTTASAVSVSPTVTGLMNRVSAAPKTT